MTALQRQIRKRMEQAIADYGMIQEDDRILIGVSGGPDSLALLKLFHDGLVTTPARFSFLAVHVDLGFPEPGVPARETLRDWFESLAVPYRIIETEISRAALDPGAKKNPCFICSHQRRRKIYETAHREGCTKIAYGHHKDDIIETLLLNILYGRQIGSMNPVQEVFQGARHIIRPLAYVDESQLKRLARESNLPCAPRLCPLDGRSRRDKIKALIAELQKTEPHANIRENIFKSQFHVDIDFAPGQNPPI